MEPFRMGHFVALVVLPLGVQRSAPANLPGRFDFGASVQNAQAVPDTTKPWRYFPLQVGNVWEYLRNDDWRIRIHIPKDTVIGARHYFKNVRDFYRPDLSRNSRYTYFLRFDTASATVLSGGFSDGVERVFSDTVCPLSADFGADVRCGGGDYSARGRYDGLLVFGGDVPGTGSDTLRTPVKSFEHPSAIRRAFAAGVGLVQHFVEDSGFALYYYRVAGVERGRRWITVGTEAAVSATAGLRIDGVFPNPFNDRLTLRYRTAAAGATRAEVFDLLGRRVLASGGGGAGGTGMIALETPGLPAGSYLVRLCDGDGACTTRPVVKAH